MDHRAGDFRVVQLTPPGSACSIAIGTGISRRHRARCTACTCASTDIEAARAELVERGVDVSEPFHFGEAGRRRGSTRSAADYATFLTLHDPDGNTWLIQEVKRDWAAKQVKRDEVAA